MNTKEYQKAYNEANKDKRAAWRQANKDTIAAYNKAYNEANKDKMAAQHKAYYQSNKDKMAARHKAYNEANKDKVAACRKAYYATPQGHAIRRAIGSKRRALKRGASIGDIREISKWMQHWQSLRRVKCHWCERSTTPKKCHADHIIPLSKGGAHSLDNLCVSCAKCNLSKNAKMPDIYAQQLTTPPLL